MSSKTWQRIWSASLKITDLRKCLFWKTTCESGTIPSALKLRYATNSIKNKQRWHLKTQRIYFTLTIKMFLSYCLSWNEICQNWYILQNFSILLLCFNKLTVRFFVLLVFIVLIYQDFIISFKKWWENTLIMFHTHIMKKMCINAQKSDYSGFQIIK